jgi:hypothetical protein
MAEHRPVAYPRQFIWELQQSRQRIYALVDQQDAPPRLEAVLTVKSKEAAALAQHLLNASLVEGPSPYCEALLQRVLTLLPEAPAASLQRALGWINDLTWPAAADLDVPDSCLAVFDEVHAQTAGLDRDLGRNRRLGELEGPVIRSVQLNEIHVHDVSRTLAAASARGFEPGLEEDRLEGDPQDLLGAVAFLLDEDTEPPGTDQYASLGNLQLLDPADGDELTGWTQSDITERFPSGWNLQAEQRSHLDRLDADLGKREHARQQEEYRKDTLRLAELFPVTEHECVDEECEDCPVELPPRMAHLIQIGLDLVGDHAAMDIGQHGDAPVTEDTIGQWFLFDQLPRIAWAMGRTWRERFRAAVDHLRKDIDAGQWPEPRNHAEEMALTLAIEEAKGVYEDSLDEAFPEHQELPESSDDYDFALIEELLFQDSDIRFLFDPETEAFADPGHAMNQRLGIGDMRPVAWFDHFNNVEPREG